jgi:hypothetical protein
MRWIPQLVPLVQTFIQLGLHSWGLACHTAECYLHILNFWSQCLCELIRWHKCFKPVFLFHAESKESRKWCYILTLS